MDMFKLWTAHKETGYRQDKHVKENKTQRDDEKVKNSSDLGDLTRVF